MRMPSLLTIISLVVAFLGWRQWVNYQEGRHSSKTDSALVGGSQRVVKSQEDKDSLSPLKKIEAWVDSSRTSLRQANMEVCEGYCDFKRKKCAKLEDDLRQTCEHDAELCKKQCLEGVAQQKKRALRE